jgi:hypothetical protein
MEAPTYETTATFNGDGQLVLSVTADATKIVAACLREDEHNAGDVEMDSSFLAFILDPQGNVFYAPGIDPAPEERVRVATLEGLVNAGWFDRFERGESPVAIAEAYATTLETIAQQIRAHAASTE